jgi:nucleoid-associated protein YgaU
MHEGAGRFAGGLILLVALWIGIYWWWPRESKITFAQGNEAVRGVSPKRLENPEPAPKRPDPTPTTPTRPTRPTPARPDVPQAIIPPEFTEYTIKSGDTFASIARQYYGSAALSSVIIAANPLMSPDRMTIGRVIRIPKDPNNIQGIPVKPVETPAPPPVPAKTTPLEPGTKTYVIQSGDTLSKISHEVYGESRLSSLIYEANRDQLSGEDAMLHIGQVLKIPPKPQR